MQVALSHTHCGVTHYTGILSSHLHIGTHTPLYPTLLIPSQFHLLLCPATLQHFQSAHIHYLLPPQPNTNTLSGLTHRSLCPSPYLSVFCHKLRRLDLHILWYLLYSYKSKYSTMIKPRRQLPKSTISATGTVYQLHATPSSV